MFKHGWLMGSLSRKLMLMYTIMVMIPVAVLSVLFTFTSFRYLETTASFATKSSFDQTSHLLEYYISNIDEQMNTILGTDEFHRVIEKDNTGASYQDQVKDMLYLRGLLNNSKRKEVNSVYLYLYNEAIYIGDNAQVRSMKRAEEEEWFRYLNENERINALIPEEYMEEKNGIGYAKIIRNSRSYRNTAGYLLFELNRNVLVSYLGDVENTQVILMNEQGDVIACNESDPMKVEADVLAEYGDGEYHVIKVEGSSWYLYTRKLQNSDWYLVYLESYGVTRNLIKEQGVGYAVSLVIVLAMGGIFIIFFNWFFIRRIVVMKEHMAGVEEKLPEPMTVHAQKDEIDDLIVSYNYMLERLSGLLAEQYNLGNQIKESELKALYEQINPHFLYNTLTMINWLAEDGQTEEVTKVITALSSFYRISLNKGKETISLEDELKIADNFVYIQQMRFGTDIRLNCEVEDACRNCLLPKLTLQPLIENALVHGILLRKDKCGEIRIEGHIEEDWLVICVEDTGMGMPQEKVEALNSGEMQASENHYGVWNVLQRASLYFKKECSLSYDSVEGHGTKAQIRMPVKYTKN